MDNSAYELMEDTELQLIIIFIFIMAEENKGYTDTFTEDYPEIMKKLLPREDGLSNYHLGRLGKRFLDLEDLKDPKYKTQSMPMESVKHINAAKYANSWTGVPLLKDCQTMNIIQHLIQYLKPKTILDIGSWAGASALYYADHCDLNGIKDYKIYSVDISHEYLHPKAKADKRIEFIKADIAEYKEIFPPAMLE